MPTTPTLQTLAFHAREFLPAESSPEEGARSSFEAVVDVYARTASGASQDAVRTRAVDRAVRSIAGGDAAPADLRRRVERFVMGTVRYLAAQYPRVEELRRDRRLLSQLFSAHLREALRVRRAHSAEHTGDGVTLRDYMTSRPGEYLVAETRTAISLEQLDPHIADLEVEEYVVGVDGEGRRTVHLHSAVTHAHILTCVAGGRMTSR